MAKKKHKLDWISKLIKPPLKASTHVFTVAGVLVAASPLVPGLIDLAHGQASAAASSITATTTGTDPINGNFNVDLKRIVGTIAVVGIGIGLVAGGAVLRRRIGRSK